MLILQHPREQDADLGSAKLVAANLPNARLVGGLSWASLASALGEPAEPSQWAVVFPRSDRSSRSRRSQRSDRSAHASDSADSADADADAARSRSFELLDRHGRAANPRRLAGIVLLDGSWSQAKSLWWRNAWLTKLCRLVLHPKEPSVYGSLRPEPRRDYLSTLEAAGAALTALGEPRDVEAHLRRVFRTLLQRARDTRPDRKVRPSSSGRAGRLRKRRRARQGRRGRPDADVR